MGKHKIPEGSLISFMSNKVKTYGGINLAQGLPGFNPPEELTRNLEILAKTNIHQYAPGNGNAKLIDLIAENHKNKANIGTGNILITTGATEAIALIFIYLSKKIGEKFGVLAFDPVYESYRNLPPVFGHNFISFSYTPENKIDFEQLEKTIAENNIKVIFAGSPGNPYGRVLSKEEISAILGICKKHNSYFVFDAVYKELYFDKPVPLPFEDFSPNIFFVDSFSKMLSITGWRIGYLIAHNEHINNIKTIHDYTSLSSPSILQEAIADFLEKSDFGADYLEKLRNKTIKSFKFAERELSLNGFSTPAIDGGYFVWTKLPEQFESGLDFAIDFYDEEKVAVVPGIHFSRGSDCFIRINIAKPLEEIQNSLELLKKFISNHNKQL